MKTLVYRILTGFVISAALLLSYYIYLDGRSNIAISGRESTNVGSILVIDYSLLLDDTIDIQLYDSRDSFNRELKLPDNLSHFTAYAEIDDVTGNCVVHALRPSTYDEFRLISFEFRYCFSM